MFRSYDLATLPSHWEVRSHDNVADLLGRTNRSPADVSTQLMCPVWSDPSTSTQPIPERLAWIVIIGRCNRSTRATTHRKQSSRALMVPTHWWASWSLDLCLRFHCVQLGGSQSPAKRPPGFPHLPTIHFSWTRTSGGRQSIDWPNVIQG